MSISHSFIQLYVPTSVMIFSYLPGTRPVQDYSDEWPYVLRELTVSSAASEWAVIIEDPKSEKGKHKKHGR